MSHGYVARYVAEEVDDYSESDCLSDGQMCQHAGPPSVPSDVTEIYRNQHQQIRQGRNPVAAYYHTMQNYYDPTPNRYQATTAARCDCPPAPSIATTDLSHPRCCYYEAASLNSNANKNTATSALRSASQVIPNLRPTCHDTTATAVAVNALNKTSGSAATASFAAAAAANNSKKYPVAARTARYYRSNVTTPNVAAAKRPQTHCLPVQCTRRPAATTASQPLPSPQQLQHQSAAEAHHYYHHPQRSSHQYHQRHNRSGQQHQEGYYPAINECCASIKRAVKINNPNSPRTLPPAHNIDSEGDVHSRFNDLENLLTKFGQEHQDEDEEDSNNNNSSNNDDILVAENNNLIDMATVSDLTKILRPKVPASIKARHERSANLKTNNANVKPNEIVASTTTPTTATETAADSGAIQSQNLKQNDVNKEPITTTTAADESFDVILQRLSSMSHKENVDKFKESNLTNPAEKCSTINKASDKSVCGSSRQRLGLFGIGGNESKPPLDDNSALELHKSKTYIVSLIDKALSKELGTIPAEKCSRDEFLSMNPKRAIDLVNRNTRYCDSKSMATVQLSPSRKSQCDCGGKVAEEPHYMKQLKQLRWSHLKHIQREAKRLADLEHFLETVREPNISNDSS